MTVFTMARKTWWRDREFFVHNGKQLRRVRVPAYLQASIALLFGLLLAFSAYSMIRIAAPVPAVAAADELSDDIVKLAAVTERKIVEIEQRQQLIAAMLADEAIDPAVLKKIMTEPATGVGGPYEPVSEDSDKTFKRLFASMKKLDTIQSGAIAVPSDKPVQTAAFTSGYGVRNDPFRGGRARHMGIDLAGPVGTPIHATADGVVTTAEYNRGGYGNLIKIDHGRGVETRYAHLSKMHVAPGTRVKRGQVIGLMGSTGRSTGSHLHYEVRIDGRAVNPVPFMRSTDYLLAMQKDDGASMEALGGGTGGSQR